MRLLPAAVALLWLSCAASGPKEICGNGIDDDGNGLTDCDDPACHTLCYVDGGDTCAKCGQPCSAQSDCISMNWADDQPLPQCASGHCQAANVRVAVKLQIDMNAYSGLSTSLVQSEATHFIQKTARDGSAVTCTSLMEPADAGPLSLETSGLYDTLAVDFEPVQTITPEITFPLVNAASGSDYLMLIELYGGPRQTTEPHAPTGRRFDPACFDTDAQLAPITTDDECTSTTPTCRTFTFAMPAPM